jgi:hypothetical protein
VVVEAAATDLELPAGRWRYRVAILVIESALTLELALAIARIATRYHHLPVTRLSTLP